MGKREVNNIFVYFSNIKGELFFIFLFFFCKKRGSFCEFDGKAFIEIQHQRTKHLQVRIKSELSLCIYRDIGCLTRSYRVVV